MSESPRTPPPRRAKSSGSDVPGPAGRGTTPEQSVDIAGVLSGLDKLIKKGDPTGMSLHIHNIINEFDPMHDDVNEWLNKVDEYSAIYGWNDRTTCHLALTKLRGAAQAWFRSLSSVTHTWTEWKNFIALTFPVSRDLHTLMTQMLQYKPTPKQSLYEYCFEKLSLINKMKINLINADKVNLILGGLDNESIKLSVEAAGIDDPPKLAAYLKNIETSSLSHMVRSNQSTSSLSHKREETRGVTQAARYDSSFSQRNRGPLCYRCNSYGHKRALCTRRFSKCMSCKTRGHIAVECTGRKVSKGEPLTPEVRVIKSKWSEKFYKMVLINGVQVECFIDFGSDCSLITIALSRKLKLPVKNLARDICLTGFGQSKTNVHEHAVVTLTVDNISEEIDLYLTENCVTGVDLLIGQNFTERSTITYEKRGQQLVFSRTGDITTLETVVPTQKWQGHLTALLSRYNTCVTAGTDVTSAATAVCMTIEVTTNVPVVYHPYRLSDSERGLVRTMIADLMRRDIIRESNSPYASPIVLVQKKSGDNRLCVDFRALNRITVRDQYPLPLIEDQLDRLSGMTYFTALDMASGYHQIPMAEDSIAKTAFVTPDGHYEYLRMPFGLTNAPAVFQRCVNSCLGQLRFSKVVAYLDDILIPSKTIDEGLLILEEVLQRLTTAGLTLNLSKCAFLKTSVMYLGNEVCAEGVRPSNIKVVAVEQFPKPKDVHNVRQFLGLTGYFRKYIPNYAIKSKPLTVLLKKDVQWVWGDQQALCFQEFKAILTSRPLLKIYDPNCECILYTDASRIGLAGVLIQIEHGKERPVAYFSVQTTELQQKMHSFELETLAIVRSVKHFRHYLIGKKFKIITDCAAVRSTLTKKDLNPRIARWALQMAEYDYDLLHRSALQLQHVDALSRNPPCRQLEVHAILISQDDWMLAAQQHDTDVQKIKEVLASGDREGNLSVFKDYDLRLGKVYRRTSRGRRWLVPKACRWQVLKMNHDDIGHFANDKTYERISSKYWFPHLRRFVKKYVRSCLNCLYHKSAGGRKPGYLHPIPKIARPFHTIHIDHMGPFVRSTKGNTQVLVIIDAFTKFCIIKAVKNTRTKWVVYAIWELVTTFGPPKRIITDRGRSFVSNDFRTMCEEIGARHHLNAVGMPRGNGQVERYNRTIKDAIATMGGNDDEDSWDQNLIKIQLGLNNTVNRAIGTTPMEVLAGYRTGLDNMMSDTHDDSAIVDVKLLRERAIAKMEDDQRRAKRAFDEKRGRPCLYEKGDLVLTRISSIVATGTSRKAAPKWKGPFKVVRSLGNDRYEVTDVWGANRSQMPYRSTVAAENMKSWIRFADVDDGYDLSLGNDNSKPVDHPQSQGAESVSGLDGEDAIVDRMAEC